jgi:hypothetical protein
MLWSPADGPGDRLRKMARYDLILSGVEEYGLEWEKPTSRGLAEAFRADSIAQGRNTIQKLSDLNPNAIILFETYFFEANERDYPKDSPWWYRDAAGKRVRFWEGCYNMDVANPEYQAHIVRRIRAAHEALEGRAGLFLDNLRYSAGEKAAWLEMITKIRDACGAIPILVNAGWESQDLEWIAPGVNGIMYEDSMHHTEDGDQEAFYGRVNRHMSMMREPRISVNEIFDEKRSQSGMLREMARTLCYTDAYFLYADSTYGHKHAWRREWDARLGEPAGPPLEPAKGMLARRGFSRGEALWLPASAPGDQIVKLDRPLRPAGGGKAVRELRLKPGDGVVLVAAD